MASALLYGSYGYTGRLITRLAGEYGVRFVLAGRDRGRVTEQAEELGLEARAFSLDDGAAVDRALADISVVLHVAGPFMYTSAPMASACIRNRAHYIDITGEIEVFEGLHARAGEARAAGVMLLPGAGYDVVPSDCLAAHLKLRLPTATHLTLGIAGTGALSRGTQSTMVEHADRGGMIRRDGKLTRVPPAWRTRQIDFGDGPQEAVTIPWGDVATSYYSTGIPNVEVYSRLPPRLKPLLIMTRYLGFLMRSRFVKNVQLKRIRSGSPGPSEEQLRRGKSYVWGEVLDDQGGHAESRVTGPNGYLLTAHTALLAVQRVLAGDFKAGFQTPSLAYGPDFAMEVPGSIREDF